MLEMKDNTLLSFIVKKKLHYHYTEFHMLESLLTHQKEFYNISIEIV